MEKMTTNTDISELVCTRISHDIIGNIGAVANAVELLEEGDMEFMDDIRSILKTSSGVLSARLKFFRMAFGLNNANLEQLDLVKNNSGDYLKTIGSANYPITLGFGLKSWQLAKIAMLGIMIVADTFIKGGRLEVREEADRLSVSGRSEFMLSKEKISVIKDIFQNGLTEAPAQYAPVFYLQELLKNIKLNVEISDNDGFSLIIK